MSPLQDRAVFRWGAGRWPVNGRSKLSVGGACAVFTPGRSALQQHIENWSRAGGRMKQVEGDVADRRTLITSPHTLHLVSYTLPFPTAREHPLFFATLCITIICGAAAELHGRDTRDERRRAGGSLLSAAEGNPGRWILPGGLGVVRLGLQDDGQSWPARLHSGKANENHSDFYILVMYFIEWAWQIGCGSRLLFVLFCFLKIISGHQKSIGHAG